jgi:hypothetical protein
MVNQHTDWLCVPIEVGRTSAPLAAGGAGEAVLDIGEPNVIGPSVTADRQRVATVVVRAIDQDAAHARVAYLAPLHRLRHGPRIARQSDPCKGYGWRILSPRTSARMIAPTACEMTHRHAPEISLNVNEQRGGLAFRGQSHDARNTLVVHDIVFLARDPDLRDTIGAGLTACIQFTWSA